MKILKIIGIVIVLLIVIPLIIALFLPKAYSVERTVIIDRDRSIVFDYVKHIKHQDEYSKWSQMDPDQINSYEGTDATVGFIARWEGNEEVGKGEQEIIRIEEGKFIETELRFIEPWEDTAYAKMETEDVGSDQTKLIWRFDGKMPYPMNLMTLFIDMESILGEDLEQGLLNAKKIIEEIPSQEEELDPTMMEEKEEMEAS